MYMKFFSNVKYKFIKLKNYFKNILYVLQHYDFFQEVIRIVKNTDSVEYINGQYNICPFCGGNDMMTNDHSWEDNIYLRYFVCQTCENTWTETYVLISMNKDIYS